jgi:hypothetical protein
MKSSLPNRKWNLSEKGGWKKNGTKFNTVANLSEFNKLQIQIFPKPQNKNKSTRRTSHSWAGRRLCTWGSVLKNKIPSLLQTISKVQTSGISVTTIQCFLSWKTSTIKFLSFASAIYAKSREALEWRKARVAQEFHVNLRSCCVAGSGGRAAFRGAVFPTRRGFSRVEKTESPVTSKFRVE